MVKVYMTWNRYWKSESWGVNPDEQIKKLWPSVTFTQLPYGDISTDKRMLSTVEYADGTLSANAWTRFKNNFAHFCFFETTPTEALALCNEWYSPAPGDEFTLDVDAFTIIDNRPPLI